MRIAGFEKTNVIILSKSIPEKNPDILLGRSTPQLYRNPQKEEIK